MPTPVTPIMIEAEATGYRRQATAEETIAALIWMVGELQQKLKRLSD